MTDDHETCVVCGRRANVWHHCLYGSNHKKCDEDDLVVPMCSECHALLHSSKGGTLARKWRRLAQACYELSHTRYEFMERYGKNYWD